MIGNYLWNRKCGREVDLPNMAEFGDLKKLISMRMPWGREWLMHFQRQWYLHSNLMCFSSYVLMTTTKSFTLSSSPLLLFFFPLPNFKKKKSTVSGLSDVSNISWDKIRQKITSSHERRAHEQGSGMRCATTTSGFSDILEILSTTLDLPKCIEWRLKPFYLARKKNSGLKVQEDQETTSIYRHLLKRNYLWK